jgi:hypothetical protein
MTAVTAKTLRTAATHTLCTTLQLQ